MRNRILQKTFWTSDEILELELYERLLFLGMTNYADDEGIIKTSPKGLKAKIFPADEIAIVKISESLEKMASLGLIKFNEDKSLCRFTKWHDHQKINRPYPSKFNFIDENNDDSVNVQRIITNHSPANKNNNKKKNSKKKKKENNEFRVWYDIYPRKIAKPKAEHSFNAMMNKYDLEEIMDGTTTWVEYWENAHTEKRYIPHPATFLNQERFLDEPDELETEVLYKLDTTGHFYVGFCAKCKKSGFYKKEELSQDSKCCKSKILPNRDVNLIQDVNAEA